jgi:hypothetical protein
MLRNDNRHLSASMNQLKANTKQNTVSTSGSFYLVIDQQSIVEHFGFG